LSLIGQIKKREYVCASPVMYGKLVALQREVGRRCAAGALRADSLRLVCHLLTEVCFADGCSSLGTFSTRFTELVGAPPSVYRRRAARATAGMPSCVAKRVTEPIRNREVRARGRG
jgi:hypothetical protein